MSDYYTENLSDFGRYEIEELRNLLTAWIEQDLPDGFNDDGVRPAMNKSNGYVFLVNDDYQCAMLNDDTLEIFHSLPHSGEEGFLDDLIAGTDPDAFNRDDLEYIVNEAETSGLQLPPLWEEYVSNQ